MSTFIKSVDIDVKASAVCLEVQKYMIGNNFKMIDKELLFKMRTRMIDMKTNVKGFYQDNLKCELQYQNIFCFNYKCAPPSCIIGLLLAAKNL